MRWNRTGSTGQIEDRRGQGGGMFGGGGGMGGLPFPGGKMAGGGLGLIGLIIALVLGGGNILGGGGGGFNPSSGLSPFDQNASRGNGTLNGAPDPDADLKDFVTFVVSDVQTSWQKQFDAAGKPYETTQLVLFEDATSTGCGQASSATGPFYCPADHKVYLDLGFFRELSTRFGAPGDFAQAYVIAHEFGHHVQNLLGIDDKVRSQQQKHPSEENALSVKLELQADCFAGVWAKSAYQENLLETGDLQEGLDAAAAVGDDRLQKQATGRVNPESFTHGTSQQRMSWFTRGYDSGTPDNCDTFASK